MHDAVRLSAGMIQTNDHVTSAVNCINDCVLSAPCDSVNFRPSVKSCQLISHVTLLTVNSTDIVADTDWGKFVVVCSGFVVVCLTAAPRV